MKEKDIYRKKYLNIRNTITNKDEKSRVIEEKIRSLPIFEKSKVIAFYKSINSEVIVDNLINDALSNKKIVLLPRVIGQKLAFFQVTKDTIFEKGSFGILEPSQEEKLFTEKIDLMIIPGISFDKERNRLGYGKGYYDRFLEHCNTFKIGVCFEETRCKVLTCDKHDIKMDLVITDKNIY